MAADGQRHVLCQEIGHTLGLDHWNTDGNNSCMNVNHVNNGAYDQPAGHDESQLDNQTHFHGGSGANIDVGDPLNGDLIDCALGGPCLEASSAHRGISGATSEVVLKVKLIRPGWLSF
jgi:hypothetical protein